MKNLLPILFLVIFAISPVSAEEMMKDKENSNATTYAIAYHADWCGSCKILGPKVKEMKASLPPEVSDKVEFIKFDFTDDDTKETSQALAEAKGLSEMYMNHAKTGQLMIVDIETGTILATIKKDFSVEEIKGAITAISIRS